MVSVRRTCPTKEKGCTRQSPNNSKITTVYEANWLRKFHYSTCLYNSGLIAASKRADDNVKKRRE